MTRTYIAVRVMLRSCLLCGEPEWDATGHAQRELTYAEAISERNGRCARCGGALVIVEAAMRHFRPEPSINWSRRATLPVLRKTP